MMNCQKVTGIRSSILETVIFETLSCHGDDAHLRLLQYLRIKGLSEEEINFFKNCYSKVVAGNQAFGRNNQHSKLDPALFTQELLLELTKSQTDLILFQKNLEALDSITSNLATIDVNKPRSQVELNNLFTTLDKYHTVADGIDRTYDVLYRLPPSFIQRSRSEFQKDLENLQEYQQSIQKAVIKWGKTGVKLAAKDLPYEPIDVDHLFEHQYRYGHLSIHVKETVPDPSSSLEGSIMATMASTKPKQTVVIPKYFTNDRILGIEAMNDFSLNQETAFFTFGQFIELSICRYFNPFPKPVNYDYLDTDGAASATVFIFEYPEMVPIANYLLPNGASPLAAKEFPNLLRKYPAVITMWASQLAVAARALYFLPAIYSSPAFSLNHDCFVTSDGSILLSGLSFDEITSLPLATNDFLHQLDYYQDSNPFVNNIHQNLQRFTKQVIYPILSQGLATSRHIEYYLPHAYSFKSVGTALNNSQITFYNTMNATTKVNSYPTYYVTINSALSLQVSAGNVRVAKVLPYEAIFGKENALEDENMISSDQVPREHSSSTLPIDFEKEYDTIHVLYTIEECEKRYYIPDIQCKILSVSSSSSPATSDPSVMVTIKSQYSCVVNLEFVAFLPNRKDLSKSERRWGCIRIEYIVPVISPATEVQDLIAYMEEYYNHSILTTVFQTNLFLSAYDRSLDDEISKNMIIDCVNDWGLIQKEIKRLARSSGI